MFQIKREPKVHDVVVIGSGAGGGTVTKVLADLGVQVTLLEAGPNLNPATDFKEHMWPHEVDHRGAGDSADLYFGRQKAFNWFNAPNGFWEIDGEPYTTGEDTQFRWFRSRIVGGRTNHYGRISLRFSDYDFNPYSTDGLGYDWPINYEDLEPYYDKAERFIGVTGTREGLRTAPDGIFQTPPPPRVHELLVKRACDRMNIPCIPSRLAIITRAHSKRAACHYCGTCGRGCKTASAYSSSQVQIFPAMKTGRVELITGAMARELITDDSGRVAAVSYIDTATRTEKQIRCRAVVLAASACESARLLLNSRGPRHSNGLANSSGTVGKFLTDNVGAAVSGYVPALEGMPKHDCDGFGGMHLYIPWWEFGRQKEFPRGYHVEIGGGFRMPQLGSFHGIANRHEGYGEKLKREIHRQYGSIVSLHGRGEMIPNEHSYCEIDPDVVDRYGIPVLKFHFRWSAHEIAQSRHMKDTFSEIIHQMGGSVTSKSGITVGGQIIHELGTVRMGSDPKASPLNGYCQAWDTKNLFVADAAPFVSNPDKNPTLTITALAWRTAEYLAEEMRKGNV